MTSITRAINYAHKHPEESRRSIARKFDVSISTLSRRVNGGLSRGQARESQQLLTAFEEAALVEGCTRMAKSGFPTTVAMVRSMAVLLLEARYPPALVLPGTRWHDGFFRRHPEVKVAYPKIRVLHSGTTAASRPKKQIKGPRVLNRAEVESEQAAKEVQEAEKVTARQARSPEKELYAEEASKQPPKEAQGAQTLDSRVDQTVHEERASWKRKFNRKGADLRRLTAAIDFLSICGRYL